MANRKGTNRQTIIFKYSGPVHVICNIQNNLDFSTINISKDGVNIAQIENDHSNNPSVINENLDFSHRKRSHFNLILVK
jgi:hypothetical protein